MAEVKSLEQIRAEHAWKFIESVEINEIESAIRKLPAMLITSGLGQTIAFCLSKDDYRVIIDNIAEHLSKTTGIKGITCGRNLLNKITRADHETYILLSREALKYTTWLKRLAEAELEE